MKIIKQGYSSRVVLSDFSTAKPMAGGKYEGNEFPDRVQVRTTTIFENNDGYEDEEPLIIAIPCDNMNQAIELSTKIKEIRNNNKSLELSTLQSKPLVKGIATVKTFVSGQEVLNQLDNILKAKSS